MSRVPTRARAESHVGAPSPGEPTVSNVIARRTTIRDLLTVALARPWKPTPDACVDALNSRAVIVDGSEAPIDGIEHIIANAKATGLAVVVVLCSHDRAAQARWIELGADAVFDDDVPLAEILDAVDRVLRGERLIGVSVREGFLTELRMERQQRQDRLLAFEQLTKREASVLQALARGKSPEDVARESYVSLNTVRTQIRGVLAKLDVNSVVAAVGLAYRTEWLRPDLVGMSAE